MRKTSLLNRFLSLALCLCMVLSLLPASALSVFATGEACAHTGGTATCATQAVCSLCGESYGDVDQTNHDEAVAFDDNGFCENGCYEPAVLNGDVYEISNAGQLYWFAAKVNGGETAINGKLIADIVVNEGTMTAETTGARAWTPIGNSNVQYTGTFDGNDKTVSGLYFNDAEINFVGLFGYVREGGKVQNVGVVNVYFSGQHDVGGVIGWSYYDTIITGCYSTGTVIGRSYVGGVVGSHFGTVTNCYNTSTVSGDDHVGGVVGVAAGTVTNCYNTSTVSGDDDVGGVVGTIRSTSTVTNCYFNSDVYTGAAAGYNDGTVTSVEGKTTAQFASGEVAYLLGEAFGQNIDNGGENQGHPVFSDATVYRVLGKDGASDTYTNTDPCNPHDFEKCICPICGAREHQGSVSYENGFCPNCDAYEPAVLNGDVYEISNAGQLYWFAAKVNGGETAINGKLIADIVVNEGTMTAETTGARAWAPIGNRNVEYTGAFDGNDKTVSGLYFNDANAGTVGLFGHVGESGKVQNVGVANACFSGKNYVGGVVGWNKGTVMNCYNTGTVSGNWYVGGVVGLNDGTVTNCYNTGTVSGNANVGGVVGLNAGTVTNCYNTSTVSCNDNVGGVVGLNDGTVTNCCNTGTVSGNDHVGGVVGLNDGTATNCYFLSETEDSYDGTTAKTAEQFASGEVAYLLQGGVQSEDIYDDEGNFVETVTPEIWGQTIGTEEIPTLGGSKVYQIANTGCSIYGEYSYSNDENGNYAPDHSFPEGCNGFCPNCDAYEPAVLNGDVYEISNAGQLYWFAAKVNGGETGINGKLMADIVVNEGTMTAETTGARAWTPIGNSNAQYTGTFDGNNKTVSGLYFSDTNADYAGLFGYLGESGKVQNVGVVNFYFHGNYWVGGVIGMSHYDTIITGCYSTGTVSGYSYVGGVVGDNAGTITDCYSTGTVSGYSDYGYVGGVTGLNFRGTVTNCYSTAVVSGNEIVGGVVADNYEGTVTNCYSTGTVSGNERVGGVVGSNAGTITDCYSTGTVSGNERVGGVVGQNTVLSTGNDSVVTNCYFNSDMYTGAAIGFNDGTATNVEGKTTAQFASGEVAYLLSLGATVGEGDSAVTYPGDIWGQTIGTEEIPTLGGETVYKVLDCDGTTEVYSNTNENKTHSFDDKGFCTNCDAYEPAVLNGEWYEISNAGQLYWFAQQVNSGNGNINGKLMADIVVNENVLAADGSLNEGDFRPWIMMGDSNRYLSGTFDGQGHTVSGLYCDHSSETEYITPAFITNVVGGTVRNVGLVDSYIRSSWNYAGGVVGGTHKATVENCWNEATVIGANGAGGIVGCAGTNTTVRNCYNTGTILSNERKAAGILIAAGSGITLKNCYNTGIVQGAEGSDPIANGGLTLENSYYLADSETDSHDGTTFKTAETFASGEVAYLLQADQQSHIWGQTCGTGLPALGGPRVYGGYGDCQDTEFVYSNDPDVLSGTPISHTYVNGFCTNTLIEGTLCGAYQEAQIVDGVYQIGNAGQLFWFAQQVNDGNKGANAVFTADIDLEGRNWTPICSTGLYYNTTEYADTGYTGTFDGQGHVISNLTATGSAELDASYGLFGTLSGTVKNLGIRTFTYTGAGMDSRVGSVVGQMLDGSLVENCFAVNVNINTQVNTQNGVAGGIAGCNYAGIVRNCFTDNVTITAGRYGGILGDNCADGNNSDGTDRPGTMDNCYTSHIYLRDPKMLGNAPSGEAGVSAEWFASGEIAYLLSLGATVGEGDSAVTYPGDIWGQTIGTEEIPTLGGSKVYQIANTGCPIYGEYSYSNDENGTYAPDHSFPEGCNGFCPNCDAHEPAVLNGDVYEISNAGQLYWFAAKVNGSETGINGKLVADIVVNEGTMTADTTGARAWTPIGNSNAQYTGTFDGNGMAVSGLYFSDAAINCVGLFGYVGEGGKVQNVGVVNACFIGKYYVGGVVGLNDGTVTNCYNTGTVSGNDDVGGVVGQNWGTIMGCYNTGIVSGQDYVGGLVGLSYGAVTNCYNTGTVSGNDDVGGVVGSNDGTVTNCYNTGTVSGNGDVGGVVGTIRSTSTVTNCYFNNEVSIDTAIGWNNGTAVNVEGKTTAQFASGEVAYLLGEAFGQNIDNGGENQGYPVFSDATVYRVLGKDGASDTYTNTNPCNPHDFEKCVCTVCGVREHQESAGYENGICTNCDAYEPAVLNGDVYEISNAGQLYWFAAKVNGGETAINGKLIADIVVNEGTMTAETTGARAWTLIGNYKAKYIGTFDGSDKTVSGLYFNDAEIDYVGLFGYVGEGGKVQNVGVVDAYFSGQLAVGGVVGINHGTVTGCYSTGTVSGRESVGGVVGWNYGTVTNCYSTGTVTGNQAVGGVIGSMHAATATNCYSTGTVTGNQAVGGVVGSNSVLNGNRSVVINCYFNSDVSIDTAIGRNNGTAVNVEGKTTAQFASGEVAYLLSLGATVGEGDSTVTYPGDIWGQTIGTEEIPTLGGKKVYRFTNCKGEVAYSNTDISGEHIDADNSGRCDLCNCLMQPAKLCMVSISLKGNIALNYYMLLSDEVLADETAYMQFTMADGEIVKIPVSQGVQTVRSGETYYVFSCAVDAKEMTDDVISQFFYDGGSTKEHTYSVQTYADHILANSSNEDMKELVKAMLNYGAASQIHFGYNTDKLANAGLEAPDYSNVTISGFNAIPGQGTELAKFYSASLILKSETTLRFFFTAPITAAYNGQELEVKQRSGLYYVDVVGIAAKDLDENVTITINDGTNTADVTYNPMAYCAAVLNDTTGAFDQEMKDVVSALYLYNQAANIYFKEN